VSVPFFTIVLRKGYGLGAQAMAGGSFKVPLFTISWPTGEFGGMGLEGAVKLGYRNELEAFEIMMALDSAPAPAARAGKKRPHIDTW
jgi:acetyl-CoA carboxylase carboxyltransferase component